MGRGASSRTRAYAVWVLERCLLLQVDRVWEAGAQDGRRAEEGGVHGLLPSDARFVLLEVSVLSHSRPGGTRAMPTTQSLSFCQWRLPE